MTKKKPRAAPKIGQSSLHSETDLTSEYPLLLAQIKARIAQARVQASLAVNHELLQLYWDIGGVIAERQRTQGWGAKVIDRLAHDLQAAFPGSEGFSRTNIYRMRSFYLAYADPQIVPQAVGQLPKSSPPAAVAAIPWGHNSELLERVKDASVRLWYAEQTVQNGWSRAVLVHQIEAQLYKRQGKAITNFHAALPPAQSDLARDILKDPQHFPADILNIDIRQWFASSDSRRVYAFTREYLYK